MAVVKGLKSRDDLITSQNGEGNGHRNDTSPFQFSRCKHSVGKSSRRLLCTFAPMSVCVNEKTCVDSVTQAARKPWELLSISPVLES